ncbi:hypothetical protein XCV2062 [Xanthomonas euvesicatoria pv. vesicatoria str. 85-10]|uniref:Uncharacterized protein n=1 Tax=Xanthomonas euvesicatoria pv. vesicatoria (strain 85-10) TaxID=316273 RepID=Q3BTX0_XANE5|nr:hypothetical protein XCV2062 [Xanthomonas euvesicatoria pv. vesicatoria str. 85-10]
MAYLLRQLDRRLQWPQRHDRCIRTQRSAFHWARGGCALERRDFGKTALTEKGKGVLAHALLVTASRCDR